MFAKCIKLFEIWELNSTTERGKGIWKNNVSNFENPIFVNEFKNFWRTVRLNSLDYCPIKFWLTAKKNIKIFLIEIGKNLAKLKKDEKKNDYDKLNNLLIQAENTNNRIEKGKILTDFVNFKKQLASKELKMAKKKIELKKCKDLYEGDKPTRCFFQSFAKTDLKGKRINARLKFLLIFQEIFCAK